MSIGTPPTSTLLLCDVCPNCGYSLQGLGTAGKCPECGRTYDQSEIILYGFARGAHENISNAKRSRLIWLLIGPFLYLTPQLPQLWLDRRWLFVPAGITILPMIYMAFRRRSGGHPGLVQVRLTNRGCVQYDDLAGPSAFRQLLRAHGWLIPVVGIVGLVCLQRCRQIGASPFWILTALFLFFAVLVWRSCRRFRDAILDVREGSIADLNAAFYKESAWRNIAHFSMTSVSAGAYRICIKRNTPFLTFDATGFAVDAEIRCNDEQAQAIDAMVRERIANPRRDNM
jgi:hypothetical protein